jgi:hypothetical protein
MTTPHELLMKPGQGTSFSIVGDIVTLKAVSEDTNGQYTLFELRVDPEIGPPPHIHHREGEAFYIQEGELEFQLGNQTVIATPGTFLYSPQRSLTSRARRLILKLTDSRSYSFSFLMCSLTIRSYLLAMGLLAEMGEHWQMIHPT